jgi:3-phenylpropionate/trans-cinnamate dioxygenase ferredoxin subunit
MPETLQWVAACAADEIEDEDVRRFDHGPRTFAIYRIDDCFYATDGWCTHERAHLADGIVLGDQIECPRHQGRFHVPTGKAVRAPVCDPLRTHPVRVEDGQVWLGVGDEE